MMRPSTPLGFVSPARSRSAHSPARDTPPAPDAKAIIAALDDDAPVTLAYLDMLGLIERLHRLLLDVIKDEFERLSIIDINAVQGLLLFNIGPNEVTAGELKSRGYYQGSNVSYNLKKLVETGYMRHQRCTIDRRSVRVSLTERGLAIHDRVGALFERNANGLDGRVDPADLLGMNAMMRLMERFWLDQIRYIY